MKYKRFIPLIVPVLIWFLAEIFLRYPHFFYLSLILGLFLIVLGVKYINNKSRGYWLSYTIAPSLFLIGFFFYSSIMINNFIIQILFLLIVWFIFIYLKDFYYYSTRDKELEIWASKLDNLLVSSGFLTIFVSASVLFDLSVFITWPAYFMFPLWALISFLLFIQFKPLKSENFSTNNALILISTLAITELAIVLSFLPLNFSVLALFLAIVYYLFLMIIRLEAHSSLNWHSLKIPIILSAITIIFLFLTARWL